MRHLLLPLIAVIFCFASCGKLSDKAGEVVYYYNLDSLLQEQHELLINNQVSLDKWAFVDGDTSSTKYVPDSAQWKDELAFFYKMNINKPILQDVYNMEVVDDTNSNLRVKQFIPEGGEELEVQYLKIYYLDSIENVKRIEASYRENNPIYKSTRNFEMTFDNTSGRVMLKSFTVHGYQKMMLKDSVLFKVSAQVKLP